MFRSIDPKPSHYSGKLNVGSQKPARQYTLSQPPQPDCVHDEPSGQTQKQLLSHISKVGAASTLGNASEQHTNPLAIETSEVPSTCSLLAAVMKSGILSNSSFTGSLPKKISQDVGKMQSQTPPPNGPPPVGFTTTGLRVDTETSSGSASHDGIAATTNSSQGKVDQPPLPFGPPPSSLVSNSPSQTSDAESKASNPISNLLSSLVAKGLISASTKDAPSLSSLQMPTPMKKKSPGLEKPTTESLNKSSSLPSLQMPTQTQKKSPGMEMSTESLNKRSIN